MSSLLGTYYKWRLKSPQERLAKFTEKANAMLDRYNAQIVCGVNLKAPKDEKKVLDRFNKLKEDFGIDVRGEVKLTPLDWGKNKEAEKFAKK